MGPQNDHDRVLATIRRYRWQHDGLPPTVREIAEASKIPLTTVYRILGKLEEQGLIRRRPMAARTIQLPLENWGK